MSGCRRREEREGVEQACACLRIEVARFGVFFCRGCYLLGKRGYAGEQLFLV